MARSQTDQTFRQFITTEIHPVLRKLGFRKQAYSFYKSVADLYHVIFFQQGRSDTLCEGRFTINLGIASPEVMAIWQGEKATKDISRNILLYERIGFLMPEGSDVWWAIGPDTNLSALADGVRNALMGHGLKFFGRAAFQSTQTLMEALRRNELELNLFGAPTIRDEIHAVLLHRGGHLEEAGAMLASLIAGKENRKGLGGYVSRIRELAARLDLVI